MIPGGPFDLILADPPWEYRDPDAIRSFPGTRTAPAANQYPTMTVEAMVAEFGPVLASVAAPDCALAIWGTWPKLPELMELGRGWGFEYVTGLLVWVKMPEGWIAGQLRMREPDLDREAVCGLGFYTRSATEFLTFWRRGKPPLPEDREVRQVLHASRREHSRKPDEAYDRLVRLWPTARRLELFARESRPGWTTWGNEATKFDQEMGATAS